MRSLRKHRDAASCKHFCTLAYLSVLAHASIASASNDDEQVVVRITFESRALANQPVAACATPGALLDALQPRLPSRNIQVERVGAAARDAHSRIAPVHVTIRQLEQTVEASLVVVLKSGQTLTRSIDATTCAEALDAIAFVAAVALDPEQGAEPLREEATAPREEVTNQVGANLHEPVEEPSRQCWSGWARFGVLGGAAPTLLGGGGVGASWSCAKPGLWSPSFTLGGTFFMSPLIVEQQGSAFVYLFSAPLDLCPSRFSVARFSLVPCVTFSGGALLAQGVNTLEPQSHLRPWLSVGAAFSFEFPLLDRLALTARGSLETPLLRYSFQFGDEVFYSVAGVSGRGTFGVLLEL